MRILALLTDADDAPGGLAQFNRDVLDALSADDAVDAVHAVCFTRYLPSARERRARVKIVAATRSRIAFAWQAWHAALKLKPRAIWCGHLHLAPVAALVARLARCPFWITLHGIDAWEAPRGARGRAAQRAAGIVSVSRHTRERALTWWRGAPTSARVLSNTVGARFTPDGDAAAVAATRRGFSLDGTPVLLTVGRLSASERYKGHDRILARLPALIAAFPQLVYVVAGEGDDRARLEALAQSLGVAAHVRFVGNVAHDALPALYRSADAFAMPSTGEGFGIAFLEAMACGVPALGLDADGSRDPLRDGALGIVASERELGVALGALLRGDAPRGDALATATRQAFGEVPFRRQVGAWLARMKEAR
jgi:phosphatidyl-myo-inositol dimannoside synthase